jgi:hypothetical protein
MNGGIVPLDLNLADIRAGLGLPAYALRPPYRTPLQGFEPATNIEDVDHIDSGDEFTNERSQ